MSESEFDISYLLELSTENKKGGKTQVRRKGVTVPSKKDSPRSAPDGAAIKAVLDNKKKTEKKQSDDFKRNRDKLLALRAKDKDSTSKMNAMLKRNNKGISAARDDLLCDADDYGYESTISQQIFDKLANEYTEIPDDESLKFKKVKVDNIADIKNRVLNSLKKPEKEESVTRKKKRKLDLEESDNFINDADPYAKFDKNKDNVKDGPSSASKDCDKEKLKKPEHRLPVNINLTNYKTKNNEAFKYDYDKKKPYEKERKDKEEEPKKRRVNSAQPPGLNFAELLKLAATKQKNSTATKVEDLVKEKMKEKQANSKKKLERPLTAMEKEDQEEERLRKLRRSGKLPNLPTEKLKEMEQNRKNKENSKKEETKPSTNDKSYKLSYNGNTKIPEQTPKPVKEKKEPPKPEPKVKDLSKYFAVAGASKSPSTSILHAKLSEAKLTSDIKKNTEPSSSRYDDRKANSLEQSKYKTSSKSQSSNNMTKQTGKSRQFPPPDVKSSRQSPITSRQFPPADRKPPGGRFNRVDSDSEYDSEMDDFIDDGEDELDYSSEIKKMFNYDKSRFRDEEEDLSDMEVGYGQLEKEEEHSAKIGLMEDLEDMKMEEIEKKRKLLRKKKMDESKGRR